MGEKAVKKAVDCRLQAGDLFGMKVKVGCNTTDDGRRRTVREIRSQSGRCFLLTNLPSPPLNQSTAYSLQPTVGGFRAAFTLIEVLLVVVVLGIAVAIAVPSFVRSIHGQRLSTAARTLTTVARYARSMAVLKQSDLGLIFNLANGQVDLVSSNTSLPSFSRAVNGVRLQDVTIEGADPVTDGTCSVPFLRNGVCVPFAVTIVDQNGNYVILKVDALGSVKSKVFGKQ